MTSRWTRLAVVATLILQGCGDSGSNGGSDRETAARSVGFPNDLAISSPTSVQLSGLVVAPRSAAARPAGQTLAEIDSVLQNPSVLASTIDIQDFFATAGDAQACYGPQLDYVNHPDSAGGTASGQLPGGDLGIWVETVNSGEACAAAQLNAQLSGIEEQTAISLAVLAAMKASYDDSGSADINSHLPSGITLVDQSFSHDEADNVYNYSIELSFDIDSSMPEESILITLVHADDGTDADAYEGLLTIQVANFTNGGNCGPGANDVTQYTSVHYIQNSENDLRLQARSVQFCGHDSTSVALHNAFNETVESVNSMVAGDVLDPDAAWADNFRVFTAEYDPTPDSSGELEGRYTLTWQAGNGDSNSRILDVGLSAGVGGESWFGFGERVQNVSTINEFGVIEGMVCNWAGPKTGSIVVQPYAQRQHLTLNTDLELYIPTNSAASDITYAPTVSCLYDGTGTFTYDRDLNGLQDEATTELAVGVGYQAASTGLEFDLMDIGAGRTDIWDTITSDRNFNLPAYPAD